MSVRARDPGVFEDRERRYVERARVARLATADADARPHATPICFALDGTDLVTPVDEKPQRGGPEDLRRLHDVAENPRVAVVVDHYAEDWSRLGWVEVLGTATRLGPDDDGHDSAVTALREKYEQYGRHDLASRPVLRVDPGTVRSWGTLTHTG